MGLFGLPFGAPKADSDIVRWVAKVEHLTNSNASVIDEERLPRPREELARRLLDEIGRLRAAGGSLGSVRRLALCYVSLARFQPGADAAGEELKIIFRPGSPTFLDWDALAKWNDPTSSRAYEDDLRFRAEIDRAGHSDLL